MFMFCFPLYIICSNMEYSQSTTKNQYYGRLFMPCVDYQPYFIPKGFQKRPKQYECIANHICKEHQ